MGKKFKFLIFLIVVAAASIYYKKIYIPKITYKTLFPTITNAQDKVFGIGNILAKNIYKISSQVSGKLISLRADEGDFVKKGELLCELDSVDLPIILKKKNELLQKNILDLDSLKKEKDNLEIKKISAFKNLQRYIPLKKKKFVSDENFDNINDQFIFAKNKLLSIQDRIKALQIEINISKKDIKSIKKRLSLYQLKSPTDGYIISREFSIGEIPSPFKPIYKIVNPKDLWIKTYIDERVSADIKQGNRADITLRSKPNQILKGFVRRVEIQSNPVTLERVVDISFDKAPFPFFINEEADVNIYTKEYKNALAIPNSAIFYKKNQSGIWICKDKKAHFKKIKILTIIGKKAFVSGIDKDTKIIIPSKNNQKLKEDMKIRE
jgi:RND family efflux transporter MFP subunit